VSAAARDVGKTLASRAGESWPAALTSRKFSKHARVRQLNCTVSYAVVQPGGIATTCDIVSTLCGLRGGSRGASSTPLIAGRCGGWITAQRHLGGRPSSSAAAERGFDS